MKIDRRHLALPALAVGLLAAAPSAFALSVDEAAVTKNLEAHRVALMSGDAKGLDAVSAPELSYSHSDGHIEDKPTMVAGASNGKVKWLSMAYENPTVRIVGDTAITRFNLIGQNQSGDKTTDVKIAVLMVWQKQHGQWKLLARSSTKL